MVLPREQGQVLFTLERVISNAAYIEHRFLWSFFYWIHVHWLEKLKYLFLFLLCFSLVDIWMLQAVHFCSFIWLINLFTAITKWQTKSNRLIINLTYSKSPHNDKLHMNSCFSANTHFMKQKYRQKWEIIRKCEPCIGIKPVFIEA